MVDTKDQTARFGFVTEQVQLPGSIIVGDCF